MTFTDRRTALTKQYRELQQQVAQGQAALLRIEGALAMLNELDGGAAPSTEASTNGDSPSEIPGPR